MYKIFYADEEFLTDNKAVKSAPSAQSAHLSPFSPSRVPLPSYESLGDSVRTPTPSSPDGFYGYAR